VRADRPRPHPGSPTPASPALHSSLRHCALRRTALQPRPRPPPVSSGTTTTVPWRPRPRRRGPPTFWPADCAASPRCRHAAAASRRRREALRPPQPARHSGGPLRPAAVRGHLGALSSARRPPPPRRRPADRLPSCRGVPPPPRTGMRPVRGDANDGADLGLSDLVRGGVVATYAVAPRPRCSPRARLSRPVEPGADGDCGCVGRPRRAVALRRPTSGRQPRSLPRLRHARGGAPLVGRRAAAGRSAPALLLRRGGRLRWPAIPGRVPRPGGAPHRRPRPHCLDGGCGTAARPEVDGSCRGLAPAGSRRRPAPRPPGHRRHYGRYHLWGRLCGMAVG